MSNPDKTEANLTASRGRQEGRATGAASCPPQADTSPQALVDDEQRFRALVESTSDWIWETGADGTYSYCSPRVRDLLGYDPSEMIGHTPLDFMPPDEAERVRALVAKAFGAREPIVAFENTNLHKDGREVVLETSALPMLDEQGALLGYRGIDRDITERIRAHQARRLNESRLDTLVKLSEMTDVPFRELADFVLEEAVRLTDSKIGYLAFLNDDETVLTMHAWSRTAMAECMIADKPLEYPVDETGLWGEAVRQRRAIITNDYQGPSPMKKGYPEGHVAIKRHMNVPVFDGEHIVVVAGVGNKKDEYDESDVRQLTLLMDGMWKIVERRRSAEALRKSKNDLQITLNSIGDAVIATDADGLIVRMNPVAERLTGYTADEACGRPLSEVFHIVDDVTHQEVENAVQLVLREGDAVGLTSRALLLDRNGVEHEIADSGAPIRDDDGTVVGVVLVFRDVGEEYALQERLRQSQKMEAIGELAGGVAHDFNNLLTGIMGNAQLISMRVEPDSQEAGFAEAIVKASTRAADLTRQLLSFSRKGRFQTIPVDVHLVIGEAVGLLKHSIDRRIVIRQDLAASPSIVTGDPGQLQNAILNLGVNARDAMKGGGDLLIATRNVMLDKEYCYAHSDDALPGPYIEISVSDTGAGMDAELQKRIFEPFFTTKKAGEGTGLGLAGVYGTVKSHFGLIHVYSKLDAGSTFKVLLPLADSVTVETQDDQDRAVRGKGRVLVVDDEETVRNFAAAALEELGYTVVACADGVEAIEIYRREGQSIDLVLLDLIMPKLDGEDAFRLMKDIDPSVHVLLASGFSRDRTVDALLGQGARGFLSKPYSIDELSREVARCILA